jgi:hypothetical protein
MKRPEVSQGKWMLFHGDEMQPPATRWIAPPRLPGREEVEAEAEAGLEDDEALAPRPALRQAVAPEKHMLGLRRAARRAVIDVAERRRVGRLVEKRQRCGDERSRHGGIIVGPARDPHEQAR